VFDSARPTPLLRAVRRGQWPLTAALFLVVLAAGASLWGLLGGKAWWFELEAVATVLVVAPAVLRTIGVPAWLASVLDVVLVGLLIDGLFGRPFLGMIPTPAGLAHIANLYGTAWQSIQSE
jgi:hypothetical protein